MVALSSILCRFDPWTNFQSEYHSQVDICVWEKFKIIYFWKNENWIGYAEQHTRTLVVNYLWWSFWKDLCPEYSSLLCNCRSPERNAHGRACTCEEHKNVVMLVYTISQCFDLLLYLLYPFSLRIQQIQQLVSVDSFRSGE